MLKDGQTDACRPLYKSMVRVEVQQVAVATSCGNAQNVLERLLIAGASRQRLNLQRKVVLRSGPKIRLGQESAATIITILMDASVRLRNLGRTSPFSPAASSSAASHSDNTVPTSCAKHSVQVRSALGWPSVGKKYWSVPGSNCWATRRK